MDKRSARRTPDREALQLAFRLLLTSPEQKVALLQGLLGDDAASLLNGTGQPPSWREVRERLQRPDLPPHAASEECRRLVGAFVEHLLQEERDSLPRAAEGHAAASIPQLLRRLEEQTPAAGRPLANLLRLLPTSVRMEVLAGSSTLRLAWLPAEVPDEQLELFFLHPESGEIEIRGRETAAWLENRLGVDAAHWERFRTQLEQLFPHGTARDASIVWNLPLAELDGLEALFVAEITHLIKNIRAQWEASGVDPDLPSNARDLVRAQGCAHWYTLQRTEPAARQTADLGETLRSLILPRLEQELQDVFPSGFQGRNWDQAEARTHELLRAGAPWIHRAILCSEGSRCEIDLLRRIDQDSKLGAFSYEPVLVSIQPPTAEEAQLLIGAFGHSLRTVLGELPDRGWVLDGLATPLWSNRKAQPLAPAVRRYEQLVRTPPSGARATEPLACAACPHCEYQPLCHARWRQERSIHAFHGMTPSRARLLFDFGFGSWTSIRAASGTDMAERLDFARDQVELLQARARAQDSSAAVVLRPPAMPSGRPLLFCAPAVQGEQVFALRLVRRQQGREEEQVFWSDEGDASGGWYAFLQFLARDDDPLLHVWSRAEKQLLRLLAIRFGGSPKGLYHLSHSLQVQSEFLTDHVALPIPGDDLKECLRLLSPGDSNPCTRGVELADHHLRQQRTGDEDSRRFVERHLFDEPRAMASIEKQLRQLV